MVIGIDYRLAASSCRGMGRYCREIVAKLFEIDNVNEYVLYIDQDCDVVLPSNFRWHKLITANFILGEQIILPYLMSADKLDVLWSPSNTFPLFAPKKVKKVVTVHDLIFMYKLPDKQNIVQRIGALYRRFVMILGVNKVDKFVTVSKFSASEMVRIFNINDIVITYNCIESFYEKALKCEYPQNSEKFYFTLSADAPSKNLIFLLNIFKNRIPNKKLVVAGVKNESPLRKQYIEPNIVFLECGVPDSVLIANFMTCEAFVYVSISEGFGIPPLEALACGAKVVCSNATSLPEVVGNYGLLINPTSEEEFMNALDKISEFDVDSVGLDAHLKQFIDWKVPASIILKVLSDVK